MLCFERKKKVYKIWKSEEQMCRTSGPFLSFSIRVQKFQKDNIFIHLFLSFSAYLSIKNLDQVSLHIISSLVHSKRFLYYQRWGEQCNAWCDCIRNAFPNLFLFIHHTPRKCAQLHLIPVDKHFSTHLILVSIYFFMSYFLIYVVYFKDILWR